MIVIIDNYDSFTYNLVQYVGILDVPVIVKRNDKTSIDEIKQLKPERLIISPGPGYPIDAGLSMDIIACFKDKCPVLGVCLGHQAIGQVFGGTVVQAGELVHGKASQIIHDGLSVYQGLPSPFTAGRYHSLVVERDSLPADLIITSETENKLIMGIRHKKYPVEGVQFHPESILTEHGKKIVENFIKSGG